MDLEERDQQEQQNNNNNNINLEGQGLKSKMLPSELLMWHIRKVFPDDSPAEVGIKLEEDYMSEARKRIQAKGGMLRTETALRTIIEEIVSDHRKDPLFHRIMDDLKSRRGLFETYANVWEQNGIPIDSVEQAYELARQDEEERRRIKEKRVWAERDSNP